MNTQELIKRHKEESENVNKEPKDLIVKTLVKETVENKDGSTTIKYRYEEENITKKLEETSNTIKINTLEELMKNLEKENN